jgi:hypothetical protein
MMAVEANTARADLDRKAGLPLVLPARGTLRAGSLLVAGDDAPDSDAVS